MDQNPAVGHALDVLQLLAWHTEPLPAAAIARDLGLPRSSTYRLLTTLADRGLSATCASPGGSGWGLRHTSWGRRIDVRRPCSGSPRRCWPASSTRRRTTRTWRSCTVATCSMSSRRAAGRPRLVTDVGVRLPAELTASGLAMLAQLPAAQLRALYPAAAQLVRREDVGPRSLADLRRTLTQTRARGYAVESGTVTAGLASVAVAVVDHTRHPVAAVAVTYPADAVDAVARDRLVEQVRRVAAALTARLRG